MKEMTQLQLQRNISRSLKFAAGLIVLTFGAYAVNFYLVHGARISGGADNWGQFGDFVGGLLNPLIAFLAFYWLTQSILLQRQELSETRAALQDSAEAQLKQERHAYKTAKINALSAMLDSYNNDIAVTRSNMEFMTTQIRAQGAIYTPQGRQIQARETPVVMDGLENELVNALRLRRDAMAQVEALLGDA